MACARSLNIRFKNTIIKVRILFTHVEVMADKGSPSDKAHSVSSKTLFVRNLPYSSRDADLEAAFSDYGSLKSCFTVKEKGGRLLEFYHITKLLPSLFLYYCLCACRHTRYIVYMIRDATCISLCV